MSSKPETIKTRSGRVVELPTEDEDARINAGIAADPDTIELDGAWFASARPAREVLPPPVYEGLVALQRSRGSVAHRKHLPRWPPPSSCRPKCRQPSGLRGQAGRRA